MAQMAYRIDLHVHTRRFSACAESLDPDHLPQRMQACGLQGLVITEHDQLWPQADIAEINRRLDGRRIYRGVEVSSRNGHFVVIGLKHTRGLEPGVSAQRLVLAAQRQGAVVILAHPLAAYGQIPEPLALSEMPGGLDAVEVASTITHGHQSEELAVVANQRGFVKVGGSDAHCLAQVGQVVTRFDRLPDSEKELAALIRSAQCRVMRRDGRPPADAGVQPAPDNTAPG